MVFAAPEAKPEAKADPKPAVVAYSAPLVANYQPAAILESRSYHGNGFAYPASYFASPYIAASPYVASPYVAAPVLLR